MTVFLLWFHVILFSIIVNDLLQDFESGGVFVAQNTLESQHRQEEDTLYQQILDERKDVIRKLDKALMYERLKAREELDALCTRRNMSQEQKLQHMQKVSKGGNCGNRCAKAVPKGKAVMELCARIAFFN